MAETEGGASVQRAAQAHSDFESPDPSQFLTLRKGDFLVILGEGDEHWLQGHLYASPGSMGYFPKNHVDLLSHPVTNDNCDTDRDALLKRQSNDFVAPSSSPVGQELDKQLPVDETDPFGDDQELQEETLFVAQNAPDGEDALDSGAVILQEEGIQCIQTEAEGDVLALNDDLQKGEQELPEHEELDVEEEDDQEAESPESNVSPSSIYKNDDIPLDYEDCEIADDAGAEAENSEIHEDVEAAEQEDLTLHYAPNGDAYYYDSLSGKTEWKKDYDERHGIMSIYPSPQPLVLDTSASHAGAVKETEREEHEVSPTQVTPSSGSRTFAQHEHEVGLHDTFGDLQLNSSSGLDPRWNLVASIPLPLIRLEGKLSWKSLKDEKKGGAPASSSWHQHWGIVLVGILIFFKEPPNKDKKKKTTTPSLIIQLDKIKLYPATKDQTKKRNAFCIISEDAAMSWLVHPEEVDTSDWVRSIKSARREYNSDAEYTQAVQQILTATSSDPPPKQEKKSRTASASKVMEKTIERTKNNVTALTAIMFKSKKDPLSSSNINGKSKDPPLFGGDLEMQCKNSRGEFRIPRVVQECIEVVEERGLQSQGIYRLSGNAASIQKLKSDYNNGVPVNLHDERLDINVVSGALKLYLRELLNPVIPLELYTEFMDAGKTSEYDARLIQVKDLVHQLPPSHYRVLNFIISHLSRVSKESAVNKMEIANLAIVFGPTLMRAPGDEGESNATFFTNMSLQNQLIADLIGQADWIFDLEK